MKKLIHFLCLLLSICFSAESSADSWFDPTWKDMLDKSDVVALVKFISDGDFHAKAHIEKIYKGNRSAGDEIMISGFSNRYGPINRMSIGDVYLVFLKFYEPTSERIEYYKKELDKKPELREYAEAYSNSNVYSVSSPTSGFLYVRGTKIQYNMVFTTISSKNHYYSLREFESFLVAYYSPTSKYDYCTTLIRKLKPANDSDLRTQYLGMLSVMGNTRFDEVFLDYITINNESSRFMLAKVLGNIHSDQSRNALYNLLKDENTIVQGETVRQLKNDTSEFVASQLLAHLQQAGLGSMGPTNLMSPVMNHLDGGKLEIIRALGELRYKPAIPALLPILNTEDSELFDLVLKALKSIGTTEYIPYFIKHLDNKSKELIYTISTHISRDSLVVCLPSLKNFIATCNRDSYKNYDFTISTTDGIGKFTDSSTVSFLLSDFKRYYASNVSHNHNDSHTWFSEYFATFASLHIKEVRPYLYSMIFDWYGFNEDFGRYPKLFVIKRAMEDSFRVRFAATLATKGYKLNYCYAFIQNGVQAAAGANPVCSYRIEVTIPSSEKVGDYPQIISQGLAIPTENVFIRFNNGWYHGESHGRFKPYFDSRSPFINLLNFAAVLPDTNDLLFLQQVLEHKVTKDKYTLSIVQSTIDNIKKKLKIE
ncbi:MAG: HEAT repeat domain-containing protein [Candidatus Kapaibacterium sp.]